MANSYNELIPGHMHLNTIAQQVKYGVYQAGGIPLEFDVIGVCDGLAMNHEGMNYSLVSREVIADSVEIMAKAHGLDGLVLIPNCDKIVPGMVMAAARLDIPVVRGLRRADAGRRLPGPRRSSLSQIFEAVGAYFKGDITGGRAVRARRLRSVPPAAPARGCSPPTRWVASRRPWAWRCPATPPSRRRSRPG